MLREPDPHHVRGPMMVRLWRMSKRNYRRCARDYEYLHGAASKVADRLDGTLDRLKAHAPAAVG